MQDGLITSNFPNLRGISRAGNYVNYADDLRLINTNAAPSGTNVSVAVEACCQQRALGLVS